MIAVGSTPPPHRPGATMRAEGAAASDGVFEETLQTLSDRAGVARGADDQPSDGTRASMLNERGFFSDLRAADPVPPSEEAGDAPHGDHGSPRVSGAITVHNIEEPLSLSASMPVVSVIASPSAPSDQSAGPPVSEASVGRGPNRVGTPAKPRTGVVAPAIPQIAGATPGVAAEAATQLGGLVIAETTAPTAAAGRRAPAAPASALATWIGSVGLQVSIAVRSAGLGGDEADALRDEVVSLLARHGLTLGEMHVNGRRQGIAARQEDAECK